MAATSPYTPFSQAHSQVGSFGGGHVCQLSECPCERMFRGVFAFIWCCIMDFLALTVINHDKVFAFTYKFTIHR
ncbi:hypothetical protein NXS19_003285 [Fusarium pseudograminearum]|nr:hypothetical protein NXS19_003285 [Fusarium pseudograminearum]